ncbi:MAG: glycosyltransferase family 2 protein [Campylobacterales bacterium]
MPKVSVVMSVHNGAEYLKESIDSVLSQSFDDFEFIIIDDGSSDSSAEIVNNYNDDRIIFIKNSSNIGLAKSLNKGIKLSHGTYIARIDADDVMLKDRLQIQLDYMEQNQDIGVCGSGYTMIYRKNKTIYQPESHDEIFAKMFFNCPMAHPTVMIRKSVLEESNIFYNENIMVAQDYDLWSRLIVITKFANIKQPLIHYREHQKSVSQTKTDLQLRISSNIRKRMLSLLANKLQHKNLILHEAVATENKVAIKEYKKDILLWLNYLIEKNNEVEVVEKEIFTRYINLKKCYIMEINTPIAVKRIRKIFLALLGVKQC